MILITGPLRVFFFREGVLERLDLEAVVLLRDCTVLTTVAEGRSILREGRQGVMGTWDLNPVRMGAAVCDCPVM